jgi:hypothetical protein
MVDLPWRSDSGTEDPAEEVDVDLSHADAVVVCEFQDGTLAVSDDRVTIERSSRSSFDDKTIPMDDIVGVEYEKGITIGYLQLELAGVEPDAGGWFSDPVNENTLHFGRRNRECARDARDEILARSNE